MRLSKTNFNKIFSKGKKITLFGAGEIAQKTYRKIKGEIISSVVDNSENLQNTTFINNIKIESPNKIPKNTFILICSTDITRISEQLISLGYEPEKDFNISPILNDLLIIEELESISSELYFTSGSVPNKNINNGGGLYKLVFDGENQNVQKIYSGSCYGTLNFENKVIFVDTNKGIMSYCPVSKKIENLVQTPKDSRAHGISYNDSTKCFYVSCSNLDGVIEYDINFVEKKHFQLSNKINYYKKSMHHCNDNYSMDNSLFVSMFSSTGNWKKGIFDGCVAEFDIKTGTRLNNLYEGLYMPHNICEINGSLQVLDSLPGHLRADNFEVIGTFPAFTRGLAYNNGFYFIGQSKNRNFSKVIGVSNNISVDCGIIIFEPVTKVSRTLNLSNKIGQIHSILFLK